MRALMLAAVLCASGCAASSARVASVPLTQRCAGGKSFDGRHCRPFDVARTSLTRGAVELDAFHPQEAVALLQRAVAEGPYRHPDHVALYEQLGVAHAYLDQEQAALRAFDRVLLLSPGHAISYTLSPKATFAFEKARAAAARRHPPAIRVTWPRDATVQASLPIEIEVTDDPSQFLVWARMYHRRQGEAHYRYVDLALPPRGQYATVALPPVAPDASEATAVETYLTVHDAQGNEVLLWGSRDDPHSIPLASVPEAAWYERWWVWTVAGTLIGAIVAITVVAATTPESQTLEGEFDAR